MKLEMISKYPVRSQHPTPLLSNRRILKLEDERVTFRYQATDTGQERLCTLAAEEFIRRFLQHILPKGFVKVRYYGFFSPSFLYVIIFINLTLLI